MFKFVIRGTRGTLPACGRNFLKYGGNTTCFSLETDQGLLIIDAGTGIVSLNAGLLSRPTIPPITILFTHFHLDHIAGLPCFAPIYRKADITFMADATREHHWKKHLSALLSSPYWPTDLSSLHASERFRDLPSGKPSIDILGVEVSWCPVFHPQGCVAYKIKTPDTSIVIATDHEHAECDVSAGFLEFCRGVDCLLYDAMYTPEEYQKRAGWGHGNWMQGVQLALEAQAKELILTHHDYSRTDSEIDEMVRLSRKFFPNTRAATENMVLSI